MNKFIPVSEPNIGKKEIEYVCDAVKSGWVSSLGKYIIEFEKQFSEYCGRKYGIATANGTLALHLALLALDIGKDDEVIIPNFTFIATASAVIYAGARVVLVDIEPDTWNIDPTKIEEKITKKTKAIIVVPIFGHPCDMDHILKIAKKYKLKVIEDAAESHGASYKGKRVGSFGDISCFSFYGNKTITTGEGGMCLTNDLNLYNKMLLLRDHAMNKNKRYWHDIIGYNYRLTNLQAAIGVAQLSRINKFINIKRRIARTYIYNLAKIKNIILPVERDGIFNTYWMFSVLLSKESKQTRDEVMAMLLKRGIDTRPLFYPLSDLPPFRSEYNGSFPVSRDIAYRGFSLPSSTKLTIGQVNYICKVLREIIV
jgi:perosamine synthetase